MNLINQLNQIVETMETDLTPERFTQFSRHLSQVGAQYKDNPAIAKLLKIMHTAGQYLGLEDPDIQQQILRMLVTLAQGLERLAQDPEMTSDQSSQTLSQCLASYSALKEKLDAHPLVRPEEMEGLKAVILSVDWEISDDTLSRFDQLTLTLMNRLRFHKILYPFVKIINTMGRYLASQKAAAHRGSVTFLEAVFDHFEQVLLNPYMPFKEKRKLIEEDIAAFNSFKVNLTSEPAEDETGVQPALSHVHAPELHSKETLVTLEDTPKKEKRRGPAKASPYPASASSQMPDNVVSLPEAGAPSQDIMGDLFSPKESEADRLMDTIHQSLVTGHQPMAPPMADSNPEGFENLIPERGDDDPIPEISNRLDDFFGMGSDDDDVEPLSVETEFEDEFDDSTPLFEGEEDGEEEIAKLVLLDEDEEDVDAELDAAFATEAETETEFKAEIEIEAEAEPEPEADTETEGPIEKLQLFDPEEDPVEAALARIRTLVNSPVFSTTPDTLTQLQEDISLLRSLWHEDPDRCLLLDLAGRLSKRLTNDAEPHSEESTSSDAESAPTDTEVSSDKNQKSTSSPEPAESKKFWPWGMFRRK